jgi:hypothetical protein
MDIVQASLNFTPITDNLIGFLGTVVTGVLTWGIAQGALWLKSKTDLAKTQQAEQLQQSFNEAALRGIAWAEAQAKAKVGGSVKDVTIGGPFVEMAANYVIKHWPDLVKRAGLTPEKVTEAIVARLSPGPAGQAANDVVVAKATAAPPASK